VAPTDTFCAKCGSRQATAKARPKTNDPLGNMSPRTASLLCYVPLVGWIAAIVVLASPRFQTDKTVRFHAFQGIYLFVAWLIVDWVISPIFHIVRTPGFPRAVVGLLHLSIFAAWIVMMVKTSQEQLLRLPIIGELAERSVAEQR
jgi:uncharacterized membrane protein